MFRFLVFTLTVFSLSIFAPSFAATIKVAAWNIEHLRGGINKGAVKRDLEDFERLAKYVDLLDADIVALQEVDGASAAVRIFDPEEYAFFFSNRNNRQRTGFAVRKTLHVVQNPDFTDLNVTGGLRHGTDITVSIDGQTLRLLSIHLKSGCFQGPLQPGGGNCGKLHNQVPEIEKWIDARATEGTPFIVLGDWNRRFDASGDTFWPEIDDAVPPNADLSRVTEGRESECRDGEFPVYIDHIALGKQVTTWIKTGSFQQLIYLAEDEPFQDKISDHCPIAITLDIDESRPDTLTQILERLEAIEGQLEDIRALVE